MLYKGEMLNNGLLNVVEKMSYDFQVYEVFKKKLHIFKFITRLMPL